MRRNVHSGRRWWTQRGEDKAVPSCFCTKVGTRREKKTKSGHPHRSPRPPPPAGSQGNMLMILLTSHAVTDSDHLFAHSLGRQTHLVVYVHCITLAKAPLTTHHSPSPVSALGLRVTFHSLGSPQH